MLTTGNYLVPILYVLAPLLLGLILKYIKFLDPLTKPGFRLLDIAVLWIILPTVIFISIARLTLSYLGSISCIAMLAMIGLGVCFTLAAAISLAMKMGRETTIALALNSAFMNVTHLGLPVVYATLGKGMLGPASLYAVAIGIPNLLLGIALASSVRKKHVSLSYVLAHLLTFPAAFALFAASLFLVFNAYLPSIIQDVFDIYLAKPFFALMLLLVGYHIPIVNPRKHFRSLTTIGIIRFVICPLVTYGVIGLLGLSIATDISPKPSLVMAIMPPAIFNVILAHNFKLDLKLYGAAVFYLTFVSLFIALPLLMYFTF